VAQKEVILEQFNLFNIFGVVVEEPAVQEDKKNNKKDKKKADKKDNKEEMISPPKNLYTGTYSPIELTKVELGSDKVSVKQIKEYLHKQHCQYVPDFTCIDLKDNIFASFNKTKMLCKGQVQVTANTKVYLGAELFDLSSIMTNESSSVEVTDISKLVHATYPMIVDVGIYTSDSQIVIVPNNVGSGNDEFPKHVCILGRETYDIEKEEYTDFFIKEGNELEDNEEAEYDEGLLKKMITDKYPDFLGHIDLQFAEGNFVTVSMQVVEKATKSGTITGKKYPTKGVTLSFIFTKFELTPEDFGGKEEVGESELLEFIRSKYPEYTKERTSIEYNKQLNMIVPILKGSSKGAIVTSESEYKERINSNKYDLFDYEQDGIVYRVESTQVSLTVASYEQGHASTFEWRLPKIPGQLRDCIDAVFSEVSKEFQTEFLILVFYDFEKRNYYIEVPKQINTAGSVQATYDTSLMRTSYPVADIHSHCFHPPFFSSIDNSDELGNRIYGVFGSYQAESKDIYRAGTGGRFISIKAEDIFNSEPATEKQKENFVYYIMSTLRKNRV